MVSLEESDFSAEFRVIGCGHGVWISSRWRRDFVTGEVLLLTSISLRNHHKLSYAPQRPWLHVRRENMRMAWSQDCSDNVLHDPAQLAPLSVSDRFLGSPDFWSSPYFGGFCVLKNVKILTKWSIHASLKNTWIYSVLLWALKLRWIYTSVMGIMPKRWDRAQSHCVSAEETVLSHM